MFTSPLFYANMSNNPGCQFEGEMFFERSERIRLPKMLEEEARLRESQFNDKKKKIDLLLQVLTHIDLTSLTGSETREDIHSLCNKAINPLSKELLAKIKYEDEVQCAAVCVYPKMVRTALEYIRMHSDDACVEVATVAGGFPSGLAPLELKIKEIKEAVSQGVQEIDVVINRTLALNQNWKEVYDEVSCFKDACGGNVRLKVILCTSELGDLPNVYCTAMAAMLAGADIIKTSTGKENCNATILAGIVLCNAIKDYYNKSGIKVGLKPAGGIKTSDEAMLWLTMVEEKLGKDWLNYTHLFRIGASSLLEDIQKQLNTLVNQTD